MIVPDSFGTLGTGTALALTVAALLCVGVAFTYSELGTLIPSSGGEYAMVGTLLGRLAGWLVFVLSLTVVMIVPPIIALGTADYLAPLVHLDPRFAAAAVMLLSTAMGLLDLRANAWITGVFLALEVVGAAVVAVLGFTHTRRSAAVLVHPVMDGGDGHTAPVTAGLIVAGLATALFILQGFSTAVYLAEEMENPRRTVARTVLWTLALGFTVVIVPVVAITLGAPDLHALAGGDIAGMVRGWSNSAVGTFISLCIALAIINAAIVMVIQNSRVVFASARDSAWPAPVNRAFSRLGRRFGSPWVATLVVGVPGALLCFVDLGMLSERGHRRRGGRHVRLRRARRSRGPARGVQAPGRLAHAAVAGAPRAADGGAAVGPVPAEPGESRRHRRHRPGRRRLLGVLSAPAPADPLGHRRPRGRAGSVSSPPGQRRRGVPAGLRARANRYGGPSGAIGAALLPRPRAGMS